MFNIGFGELLVIVLVIIYMVKPQHFPVIARILVRRFGTFRDSMTRIKAEFNALADDLNNKENHEK